MWTPTLLRAALVLVLPILWSCSGGDSAALVVIDSDRGRSIEYRVWAPENQAPAPLLLVSHGTGGHYSDHAWLIKRLVANGYLVAALNHPGDTRMDSTPEGLLRVWDRPGDVSALLTELLDSPQWSAAIDESRIAALGFSSGGYTVIALAGGRYNPEVMRAYCDGPERDPSCDLVDKNAVVDVSLAGVSNRDERIKAVFAMAPAVGPGVDAASLGEVAIPVLIVAAADDELVRPESNAAHYAENIRGSEFILLPVGGHFAFIDCTIGTRIADIFIQELNLCGDGIDVDRAALHDEIAQLAISFLNESLAAP